jgi:hypothetical protein
MLMTFLNSARLKRWISRPSAPAFIKELKSYFDEAFGHSKPMDTLDAELPATQSSVPEELKSLLPSHSSIWARANISWDGKTFSASCTHLGNSFVEFYRPGITPLRPEAGRIEYIFSTGSRWTLAIRPHKKLVFPPTNPFRFYPEFPAYLALPVFEDSLVLVPFPASIISHYVCWNVKDFSILLSLTEVRF